ncbi:hypothetical protein MNEG_5975 [Monoraphidium neglectum]|uniref:Uncharacterized protein n=1 Tax=Monoraphidium neglectum TaxID=145388 RepID=A0A0D2MN41_9CHLO|nr:hypothetical protein MNEG_5975 [Monoraphidium neglectum]KIZ01987.1 hypothetical protein MNEG_5975 [Monoraphidium neglectum]|eukprot:XP_013901006.1 hypothetical protein MNEG_5975 [Monoraphidium neglectum]
MRKNTKKRTLAIPTRQTPISGGTATPQPWQQPSSLTHPHQTEDEVSSGISGGGGNLGVQGRSPLAPIAVTEVNWPPHCSGADLLLPSEGTDPATIAEARALLAAARGASAPHTLFIEFVEQNLGSPEAVPFVRHLLHHWRCAAPLDCADAGGGPNEAGNEGACWPYEMPAEPEAASWALEMAAVFSGLL